MLNWPHESHDYRMTKRDEYGDEVKFIDNKSQRSLNRKLSHSSELVIKTLFPLITKHQALSTNTEKYSN